MSRVLILYGTTDGHTRKIAAALREALRDEGVYAYVTDAEYGAATVVAEDYDGVIVAASVHGGRYQKPVTRWARTHAARLNRMPSAFVSVCLAILEKRPEAHRALDKIVQRFQRSTGWRPDLIKPVAGALPYTRYNWLKRWIMRRIVAKAGGDTDTTRDFEYTDWDDLRAFAHTLGRRLTKASVRPLTEELVMTWGPIVVGVDASSEAAGAATVGYRIARAAAENCDLVHATPDAWAPFAAVGDPKQVEETQRLQLAVARHRVTEALRSGVAPELLEGLDVRLGPSAVVLQKAVRERGAGLLVLGGKHHTALERWLGGSTSLNVVRTTEVPVLVTTGSPATTIRRVLVAADLSGAARPTLALAERFARLVGAQLRVLSVFEPLPTLPDVPPVDPASYYGMSQDLLQREIWPLVRTPGTEKIVRHGMVVETLLREVTDWSADVLVVGSHGKGWAQRILLGSVTERLLNDLPTSLLVAPVGAPVPAERRPLAETAAA